jgi:2-C-methyl-D-erythritol 2,4-cyclodiphosphate synthase
MRVGLGFDVHRLKSGKRLVLGGVIIPFKKGLVGHSDADVLIHAIIDALLGAIGMGDIGAHFPDTDPKYAGISSLVLLAEVERILRNMSKEIINLDAVVIAEEPKISPFISLMKENLAQSLNINRDRLNIKATTTENLGFTGRGEGIAAQAVVLIRENKV